MRTDWETGLSSLGDERGMWILVLSLCNGACWKGRLLLYVISWELVRCSAGAGSPWGTPQASCFQRRSHRDDDLAVTEATQPTAGVTHICVSRGLDLTFALTLILHGCQRRPTTLFCTNDLFLSLGLMASWRAWGHVKERYLPKVSK